MLRRFAVDVPYGGEWFYAPLILKSRAGLMTLGDLWAQHNEHRTFFPAAAMLLMAQASGWNVVWEMAAQVVLAGALFGVCASLLLRLHKEGLCCLPAVSLLIFSLAQWGNWLWGAQLYENLSLLAYAGALAVISAGTLDRSRLAAALLCGAIASYSFSSGLWSWIAIPALLAASKNRRAALTALVFGAAVTAFYFIGYEHPGSQPNPEVGDPFLVAHYALLFLGSSVCNFNRAGAALAGALGLAALIIAPARLQAKRIATLSAAAPLIALASLAAASAAAAGVTRLGFGRVEQAMSSRYAAIGALIWIADVSFAGLLASALRPSFERRLWRSFLALLVAGAAASSLYGAVGFAYRGRELASLRDELLRVKPFHVTSLREPAPGYIEQDLIDMREEGLSLFRTGAPAPAQEGRLWAGSIEVDGKRLRIVPGAVAGSVERHSLGRRNVELYGWAADPENRREASAVLIFLGADLIYSGPTFLPRPELAWRSRALGLLLTGFSLVVPAEAMVNHADTDLRVFAAAHDGRASELVGGP